MDLFEHAKQLRDTGMHLAEAGQMEAAPEWHACAYAVIVKVARESQAVHIDDILQEFTRKPKHPNAWGAVWMRAIRAKVIKRSGLYAPCRMDPAKHAHQYPIYDSLIYER